MKKVFIKSLFLSLLMLFCIIPIKEVNAATFTNYTEKLRANYIVPYGKEINIQKSNNETITSDNAEIAQIVDNKLQIIGVGSFTLTVKKDNSEEKINFFAWNTYLKKGKYYVYNDENKTIKDGIIRSKTYLAISKTNNSSVFKIEDYFFKTGKYSGTNLKGKYITSYYNAKTDKSNTSYYRYSLICPFEIITPPVVDPPVVVPPVVDPPVVDPPVVDPPVVNPPVVDPPVVTPPKFDVKKTKMYAVKNYKLSSGKKMSFWLYTPEYVTENMPLIIHWHGNGESGVSVDTLKSRLPLVKNLYNHKIGVNAIIIIPQCPDTTRGYITNTFELLEDLKSGKFVDKYNRKISINKNKIALIGFSQGTNRALSMSKSQVQTFRCFILASGHKYGNTSYFKNAKAVLTILGSKEVSLYYGKYMKGVASRINSAGGNATYKQISGANHSGVQSKLGSSNTYLNWCLNHM